MLFKTTRLLILLGLLFTLNANSQTSPFTLAIEPVNISGLGGLQSFAFGQHNGKWLIVGGSLDGLHQRQPFAAFDVAGHNNELIVVDPVSLQKWSAPLTSLPTGIQEQLSSTNMEFYQEGDYLYCLGGYGFSATAGDHTTYPNLTSIRVDLVIDAIINGTSFTSLVRQITDTEFQVTGGRLKKLNSNFYLLGGQKFIGRYNPMGPTNGPGFIQEYSNSIRIFTIADDGTNLTVNHLPSYTDTVNLHRRDYNAEAQIMPNGDEGITMFSGVFQYSIDMPFLNAVNIDASGYTVNNSFQQYYNHYHCGVVPLYSASNNEMHTVFFGGIAQYYDSLGTLIQDDNVPFVNTIARVTRDASGVMAEYKLPIEMPTLLGAGAEFIPNLTIPHYNNEVFKLDDLTADSTLLGYIYGGISSTEANIFFINDGTQSSASSQIFKVYLINAPLGVDDLNEQSIGTINMKVYPNPNKGIFSIQYNLVKTSDVKITINDTQGRLVSTITLKNQQKGENIYSNPVDNLSKGGVYFISLETSYEKFVQKIIIED